MVLELVERNCFQPLPNKGFITKATSWSQFGRTTAPWGTVWGTGAARKPSGGLRCGVERVAGSLRFGTSMAGPLRCSPRTRWRLRGTVVATMMRGGVHMDQLVGRLEPREASYCESTSRIGIVDGSTMDTLNTGGRSHWRFQTSPRIQIGPEAFSTTLPRCYWVVGYILCQEIHESTFKPKCLIKHGNSCIAPGHVNFMYLRCPFK